MIAFKNKQTETEKENGGLSLTFNSQGSIFKIVTTNINQNSTILKLYKYL